MKKGFASYPRSESRRSGVGSALIIVLCFVVLLTVVVLAMLSHSIFNGLISNASSNVSKADLYGHGAIDQIIGDLRQEMVSGSTATTITTGSVTSTLYRPNYVTNSVPYNSGPYTTANWTALPNLVKESYHGAAFEPYDSSLPSRASTVSTTSSAADGSARLASGSVDGTSRNGRYVSVARWNKALLLPKNSATFVTSSTTGTTITSDTGTDPTPTTTFVAPDWIFTTADGSNMTSTTLDTSTSTTTSNVYPKSPKYVVGRYAYTIYNEGGLLDANVAGCVATSTTPAMGTAAQKNFYIATVARKGPSAFADLTQLPGLADIGTVDGGTSHRAQQIVDALIGWRNAATAQSSVFQFPIYSSTPTSYFSYLIGLSTNFMSAGNTSLYNGVSDRIFTSRQELINYLENVVAPSTTFGNASTEQAYLQDAMMYLGTFSRTLNQPSYWPDSTRPKVISPASDGSAFGLVAAQTGSGWSYAVAGINSGANPYGGGNSAYQLDDYFNPSFRSIRVAATVTGGRNDHTDLTLGDPLVKKRFALCRLMWLTYKGPSAQLATSDALFQQYQLIYTGSKTGTAPAWLTQLWNEGTTANIQAYFGLTWEGTAGTIGGYWYYNHGLTSGTVPFLGSLSDVAAAGREPDFFELLKTAVNCGAVGKCLTTNGNSPYSQKQDSTVTPQIMQLGANIIDEANPTQYPTHITYNFGTVATDIRSVYGAMDLPYYAGLAPAAYIVKAANPAPTAATVNTPVGSASAISTTVGTSGIYPNAAGTGVLLEVPSIWNPYDVNSPPVASGLAPSYLRIAVAGALTTLNANLNGSSWPGTTPGAISYLEQAYFSTKGTTPVAYGTSPTDNNASNPGPPYYKNETTTYQPCGWTSESSAALTFSNPSALYTYGNANYSSYREPTALIRKGVPDANLTYDPSNWINAPTGSPYTYPASVTEGPNTAISPTPVYMGFLVGTFPLRWTVASGTGNYIYTANGLLVNTSAMTVRMEYSTTATASGPWIPYMEYTATAQENAMVPIYENGTASGTGNGPYLLTPNIDSTSSGSMWDGNKNGSPETQSGPAQALGWDPRSTRWGYPLDGTKLPFIDGTPAATSQPATDQTVTLQPGTTGFAGTHATGTAVLWSGGFEPTGGLIMGYKQQNLWSNPASYPSNLTTDFYMDPDATVRRALGAYVSGSVTSGTAGNNNWVYTASTAFGLPLAGTVVSSGTVALTGGAAYTPFSTQTQSRPIVLHRPYRSVAELGHVFSDTPFKNIDFFTPESGYSALLDVFCINEDYRTDAVAAGRVDLNTKQAPVIQALLAGAYRDEENNLVTPPASPTPAPNLSAAEAIAISQDLVKRTSVTPPTEPAALSPNLTTPQPLSNIGDLVGRWISGTAVGTTYAPTYAPTMLAYGSAVPAPVPTPLPISGAISYDGFSSDLSNLFSAGTATTPGQSSPQASGSYNILQRFRESAMRALSDAGQAGTWNLMIDVVAQSGRYPSNAAGPSDFLVEGERRFWVHVAIDRGTGQIIDENIEPVNE